MNGEEEMKEILLLLVMFWNVENYFDPFDSGVAADEAFTPRGEKFWNWKKFEKKRDDLAKTILLVGEEYGVFPALVGLCEVENWFVLNRLVNHTPLARVGYKIIHKDSPDPRGIDVALLYNPNVFRVLGVKFIPLRMGTADSILPSRLILYARGVVNDLDTLHCFVNHWPSKLGGEKRSLPRRMLASGTLKMHTDSILRRNRQANILLMGDFNDRPGSLPLKNLVGLDNLAEPFGQKRRRELAPEGRGRPEFSAGTHKYKGRWELIDQFLVSESLAPERAGKQESTEGSEGVEVSDGRPAGFRWMYCKGESMQIFRHPFLLQRDKIYLGDELRKTLSGPRYLGGVSDHLPIVLKIFGRAVE